MSLALERANSYISDYLKAVAGSHVEDLEFKREKARESVSALWLTLCSRSHVPVQQEVDLEQVSRFISILGSNNPPSLEEVSPSKENPKRVEAASTKHHFDHGLSSLLTLREKLTHEVEIMEATQGALAEDAESLNATAQLHSKLSKDSAASRELVKAWQRKQRDDVGWVRAAAWLLTLTSLYIFSRRVAWVFAGIRVDEWVLPWKLFQKIAWFLSKTTIT